MRTAIILGSTGLVGSNLLDMLLQNDLYSCVKIVVRKEIEISHSKLIQHLVDFDHIDQYKHLLYGDVIFCCLGTTIKKAGSKEMFRKIDFNYPINFAKIGFSNGIKHFIFISSIGASSSSRNYYLKTKGLCEDEIKDIQFDRISILRPSILTGLRKEFRFGEKCTALFLGLFSFVLIGKLRKYRPISARQVARCMFVMSQTEHKGIQIYESDKIAQIQ